MKSIKLNLFEFDELSQKAKEKALKDFWEFNVMDDWYTFLFENFVQMGKLLGLTVPVKEIYFRGFYSQGDGSGFNAEVDLPQLLRAIFNGEWKNEYPKTGLDFSLPQVHPVFLKLVTDRKIELYAEIRKSRNCYAVSANITDELPQRRARYEHIENGLDKLEGWLKNFAETLNRFLYRSLETEYEYLTGEEAITDAIKANGYHFTIDGKCALGLEQIADNDG